ncbi:hypothetical protein [Ferruginibacter sp.]
MPYRNRIKFVFCLLILSLKLSAQQDVTGLWTGFMYNDTTQQNYRYEIAISENKGKLFGYSHTYFIVDDKQYHGVKKLKIKRDGDKIITEDDELIVNNYPIPPAKGVHQENRLVLEIKDTVMILSGLYSTNRTRDYRPLTGYVHVERKKDYQQSALVPHLQELGLAKNLTFLNDAGTPAPAEPTLAVLKPMRSDEEEKLIQSEAKRREQDNTIRPATAKVVVKNDVPKPPAETVVAKPVPAKTEPPVVKAPPVKTPEPVVTKPAPVKASEPVAVSKPAPAKTEPPAVVKATPPPVKAPEPAAPKPAVVKPAIPVDPTAAVDAGKRKVENIQALYFKSDSLQLILYDNGEVDGDTVSVIMNGEVIMPKVGLSTNAVKKTIDTRDIGDSIQLVMYAESLGTLPPNTGLLIVYDGNDRYEIRFSGDMQKSSGIVFRRRKE